MKNIIPILAITICVYLLIVNLTAPKTIDNTDLIQTIQKQFQRERDSLLNEISINSKKIVSLNDSIAGERKNRIALENKLYYQISVLKHEIKTIDYTVVTDSALLIRLRAKN